MQHGIDIAHDISKRIKGYNIKLVFDVGANVGQSVGYFLEKFPQAQIFAFEPVSSTYQELQANVGENDFVRMYKVALSDRVCAGEMVHHEHSREMCYLRTVDRKSRAFDASSFESVDVTTIDLFCSNYNIKSISYLKIDTEGSDLDVLKGATQKLCDQSIDFIEVEAGMNPHNHWHIPLEQLKDFLEKYNYFLFGIYEQMYEWPTQQPHLRRSNLLFVSSAIINRRETLGS